MNLKIKEITGEQGWLEYQDEWNALVDSVPESSVFMRFEWLHSWWRFLAPKGDLCIAVVHDESRNIKTVFPFLKCSQKIRGKFAFSIISLLGSGYSDYLDIIGSCIDGKVLGMVREHFLSAYPRVVFQFSMVSEESRLVNDFWAGGIRREVSVTKCPYLSLPADSETFWRSLGKSTRDNIRRGYKKIGELGKSEFRVYRQYNELEKYLRQLFEMQSERFGDRVASREKRAEYIGFAMTIAEKFCREDITRLIVWSCDDEFVAGQLCLDYKNKRYFLFGSFNEKYHKYDPGKGIIAWAILNAIEGKMQEYDFLGGDEPYKYFFTDKDRQSVSIIGGFSPFTFYLYNAFEYISGLLKRIE
jgi:CelD/BcsL family acetyltransferase involved in cellulose biosynthesis